MNKIKKIYIIITLIIILIIIPLSIHLLYKLDMKLDILTPTWSSGEILQYYGSIIGALLAIGGVVVTLEHNRQENKKTMKQNVRPYLDTIITEIKEEKEIDDIFNRDEVVCFYDRSIIQTQKLNSSIGKDFFDNHWFKGEGYKKFYIFKYEIQNVGLGSAINCKVKINKRTIVHSINIHCEKNLTLYIFIRRNYIENNEDITIDVYFKDMFEDVVYKQSDILHFQIDIDGYMYFFQNIEDSLPNQVVAQNDEYENDIWEGYKMKW